MKTGKFREYTWGDIMDLIYKDSGLEPAEEGQSAAVELWFTNGFNPSPDRSKICVRVKMYGKPS